MSPIINFKFHWPTRSELNKSSNKKYMVYKKLNMAKNEVDEIIFAMDFSPLDLNKINKSVAHKVNITMGVRDGGNVNIAVGRVIYPSEQEERRVRVLNSAVK